MSEKVKWYINLSGQLIGPYEASELQKLIKVGDLKADDLIFKTGEDKWGKVVDFPELQFGEMSAPQPTFAFNSEKVTPAKVVEEITASGVVFSKEDSTIKEAAPAKMEFAINKEPAVAPLPPVKKPRVIDPATKWDDIIPDEPIDFEKTMTGPAPKEEPEVQLAPPIETAPIVHEMPKVPPPQPKVPPPQPKEVPKMPPPPMPSQPVVASENLVIKKIVEAPQLGDQSTFLTPNKERKKPVQNVGSNPNYEPALNAASLPEKKSNGHSLSLFKSALSAALIMVGCYIAYQTYEGKLFNFKDEVVPEDNLAVEVKSRPTSAEAVPTETGSEATVSTVPEADPSAPNVESAAATQVGVNENSPQTASEPEVKAVIPEKSASVSKASGAKEFQAIRQIATRPPEKTKESGKKKSFQVQLERKKLFRLVTQIQKQTDALRQKNQWPVAELKKWKKKFNDLKVPEFSGSAKGLVFSKEWRDLKKLHDQWLKTADVFQGGRKVASVGPSVKDLKKKTIEMKKKVQSLSLE